MADVDGFEVLEPEGGYFGIIKVDFTWFKEELGDSVAMFKALVNQ